MTRELTREERLKRLTFRAWHRGTKEADIIFGSFADAKLGELDDEQIERFERLLDVPDQDLLSWIMDRRPVPDNFDHDVMALIKRFDYAEGLRALKAGPL